MLSAESDEVGSVYSGVEIDLHEVAIKAIIADRRKGNNFPGLNMSPKFNARIAPF
jgi:hypothetical protein